MARSLLNTVDADQHDIMFIDFIKKTTERYLARPEFDAYIPVLAGDNETSVPGLAGGVHAAPTAAPFLSLRRCAFKELRDAEGGDIINAAVLKQLLKVDNVP